MGRVSVSVTGGTPPYTYSDGGSTNVTSSTGSFEFVLPGSPTPGTPYTLTLIDSNGCTATPLNVNVEATPDPVLAPLSVDDVCTHDGSYVIQASGTSSVPGGTGALRFQLDTGVIEDANQGLSSHAFTVSTPGTYSVVVYDENNCVSGSETITILPALIGSADFTATPTCRNFDGDITVAITGGSDFSLTPADFTFALTGTDSSGSAVSVTQSGLNSNIFTGISAGSYSVLVTNLNTTSATGSCSISIPVPTITIPVDPIVTAISTPERCVGANDGTILITLTNPIAGDGPYTYQLFVDDGSGSGTPDLTQQVGVDQLDSPEFRDLAPGDYVGVVTSSKICSGTTSTITVVAADPLVGVTSITSYSCAADNSEIYPLITVTITGGVAPYSIGYTTPTGVAVNETNIVDANGNPADGVQYEILAAEDNGDYVISVTDSNGCSTAPPTLTETLGVFPIMRMPTAVRDQQATCISGEDVLVSVDGGSSDFTFEVISGPTSATLPAAVTPGTGNQSTIVTLPNELGVYGIEILDNVTGCTIEVSYEVLPYDLIVSTAMEQTPEFCFGDGNGQASVSVAGYVGDLSYEIYDTGVTPEVVVFSSTVNLTTDSDPVTADVFVVPPSPSGLTTGNYRIVLTQLGVPNCTDEAIFIISGPSVPVSLTLSPINDTEFCDPSSNGAIQSAVTGARGTVSYELASSSAPTVVIASNPEGRFEGLVADTYEVTVIDDNGAFSCRDTQSITINPPADDVVVNLTKVDISCFGVVDGSITVTATGTDGPFEYTITPLGGDESGRQTTTTFEFLSANTYEIRAYDVIGCFGSASIDILEPNEVTVSVDAVTEVTCLVDTIDVTVSGVSDVAIERHVVVNISDLLNPVESEVVTNATTHTFTGLTQGDYQFYVIDVNGCSSQLSVGVSVNPIEPISISLDLSGANVNCTDEPSGVVSVATITGGIGSYAFQLTNQTTGAVFPTGGGTQDSDIFIELPPGDYEYVVTSDRSCSATASFTIANPPLFEEVDPEVNNISCFGEDNGSVVVFAQGGTITPTEGYVFAISTEPGRFFTDDSDGVANQHTFTDLAPGSYQVFAQDANGCGRVYDIEILEPNTLGVAVNGTVVGERCEGDMDGEATISITGGTPPYFTNITNNDADFVENQLTYTMLPSGQTIIFIRDSNDCRTEIAVDIPRGVVLTGQLTQSLVCPTIDYTDPENPIQVAPERYTVGFVLDPTSVTTGIQFMLTGINGTPDPSIPLNSTGVFDVNPGEYEGVMEHSGGCIEIVGTILVEAYTPLEFPVIAMTGNPSDPNEYSITPQGGTPPYEYEIFNAMEGIWEELSEPSFSIRETGIYTIRVRDSSLSQCEVLVTLPLTYIGIKIPNFFTPDGNPTNGPEFWYPVQISSDPNLPFLFNNMQVSVFDRYGRLLKEFRGDQQGWDGMYQGKELPSGDYWFTIILNDVENREYTGHFTLYR